MHFQETAAAFAHYTSWIAFNRPVYIQAAQAGKDEHPV